LSKENTAIYAILGLLQHEDLSGYDIKKKIDMTISNFWDVGYGQLYPSLKVLEKDGFVTKIISDKSKGPSKIIYSITESGSRKLREWLSIPGEKEYVKYEILLKLFFGSLLPKAENINRITEFKEKNEEKLKLMNLFKKSLSDVFDDNPDHYYYYLTVLFGEHMYRAYALWAKEAVELLNEKFMGVE
jgi:DNA-binding PadR family transcriptional regulator